MGTPDPYRLERETAARAAVAAGELLLSMFRSVRAREKAPGDLVTDADLASQKLVAGILREAFPGHTLLAEEENARPEPENPWRWIVDPLDGTVNYAHGITPWCVSIALEHEGELVVGAIHVPWEDRLYLASKGAGTTVNGSPARVSGTVSLSDSLIATGFPTSAPARDADRILAYFRAFAFGTHSVRRTGSSAWNLAQVAAGSAEICYATTMQPWDAAAGVVLVREAGGMVTDLEGNRHDLYAEPILATNGAVHGAAVRALAEAWPDSSNSE